MRPTNRCFYTAGVNKLTKRMVRGACPNNSPACMAKAVCGTCPPTVDPPSPPTPPTPPIVRPTQHGIYTGLNDPDARLNVGMFVDITNSDDVIATPSPLYGSRYINTAGVPTIIEKRNTNPLSVQCNVWSYNLANQTPTAVSIVTNDGAVIMTTSDLVTSTEDPATGYGFIGFNWTDIVASTLPVVVGVVVTADGGKLFESTLVTTLVEGNDPYVPPVIGYTGFENPAYPTAHTGLYVTPSGATPPLFTLAPTDYNPGEAMTMTILSVEEAYQRCYVYGYNLQYVADAITISTSTGSVVLSITDIEVGGLQDAETGFGYVTIIWPLATLNSHTLPLQLGVSATVGGIVEAASGFPTKVQT